MYIYMLLNGWSTYYFQSNRDVLNSMIVLIQIIITPDTIVIKEQGVECGN